MSSILPQSLDNPLRLGQTVYRVWGGPVRTGWAVWEVVCLQHHYVKIRSRRGREEWIDCRDLFNGVQRTRPPGRRK